MQRPFAALSHLMRSVLNDPELTDDNPDAWEVARARAPTVSVTIHSHDAAGEERDRLPPWTINYHNISDVPVNISKWTGFPSTFPQILTTHAPTTLLRPNKVDYLEVDQNLSSLGVGPFSWWQAFWVSGDPFQWVKINVPMEWMKGELGYAPTWSYVLAAYGQNNPPTDWGPEYKGDSLEQIVNKVRVTLSGETDSWMLTVKVLFEAYKGAGTTPIAE